VLRLDPNHFEARHNLVLLTHWAGAKAEAQHHLQKLEATADKNDERLALLKVSLSSAQTPPAQADGATR
jgi:cytochrome c-type biogenesis protein CcmH/NrfG